MKPLRGLGLAAAILLAASGAACALREVNSFTERGADFSCYHTYAWRMDGPRDTGDPRLDSNPFVRARVGAAIDRELARRGLALAPLGTADLNVAYYVFVDQRLEMTPPAQPCSTCKDVPSASDVGTLIIDLVDPHTNALLWRGWAEGAVDGLVDNQSWLEEAVDRSVGRIFDRFPRAGRGY